MVLTPMNTLGEHKEEIDSRLHAASAGDEPHTQRLPPGRRLEAKPRRPKALLLFTVALTLLLVSAVIAIRGNKPGKDTGSAPLPVDQSTTRTPNEAASTDPVSVAIEQHVAELGAQLALQSDEVGKKIDENAEAIRSLGEKLASLPTPERVAALEDALKQSRDAFVKDIARLEQSLARLRSATTPKVVKPYEAILPFQLVSLDLWDGIPYVGLSQDGRIELVRAGQTRGGWTVEHIDYGNGKVRFRNASGQSIERAPGR
jgi:hypothetical protein